MNILFVYSYYDIQSYGKPLKVQSQAQLGISYISSLLKKNGHNTELIVLSKKFGRDNKRLISGHVERFNPQVVCFTAVFTEYSFIAGNAEYLSWFASDSRTLESMKKDKFNAA
ncbi:MAG: hypothetical protein A3J81_04875 [Nitrospirae bacterium RIFOXYB2_FULL_43_5]|nr:MAG: hypothetical protein A2X54_09380 [Nitrospirae bacterium GWF2_44_13]OGW63521.1 MAG: hypothetical protein A2222_06830 [Nitrospirae bacterium RIFOXYA2_FULL_44_9]OGW72619.1 MAG: hypothetical protein A2484_09850 [Nitrospirae bacterium RIFOXYC2_FULL_44_7]OGW78905.1 MAG: hypothetical protein A3J81_04875 [Nitrospirae bacterium RIFOXYB2_FULL_43_5]